jgi:hypothetical protein
MVRPLRFIGTASLILALAGNVPAVCCISAQTRQTHSCCSLPTGEGYSEAPCCAVPTCTTSDGRQATEPTSVAPAQALGHAVAPAAEATFSRRPVDPHVARTSRHFLSPALASLATIVLIL